jgi:alkylation response protein AidB-like acyl-CoA dehydrogenase
MTQSFFLGEDQRIFRESLSGWLDENWSLAERRRLAGADPGFSRSLWKGLAEIGALGAFLPERAGGAGGGGIELMLTMEACGRRLVAGPLLSTVALAAPVLAAAGPGQDGLLGAVARGEIVLTTALTEPRSRYDLQHVETRAERRGAGYRISGVKKAAPYGGGADWILLPARTAGESRDARGITLFLVEARRPGIRLASFPTADGGRAADVTLEGLEVDASAVIGAPGEGLPALHRAVDLAMLAQAAEAVGSMRVLLDATVAYTKTREQFGATLGSFQALQHRMVDMFAATELAASRVQAALARIAGIEEAVDPRDAVMTKLQVDKAARLVGQEAVQIHGGMGMTDDLDVGHHFKRLTLMALTFADQGKLIERYRSLQAAA